MSKHQILIVDDNPYSVSLISVVLSKNMDCELSVAFDGASAIKKAQEIKPDLILMDWQMPGIDGIRSIELLKEDANTASIPVIMITCLSEMENRLFQFPALKLILKPRLFPLLNCPVHQVLFLLLLINREPINRLKLLF